MHAAIAVGTQPEAGPSSQAGVIVTSPAACHTLGAMFFGGIIALAKRDDSLAVTGRDEHPLMVQLADHGRTATTRKPMWS